MNRKFVSIFLSVVLTFSAFISSSVFAAATRQPVGLVGGDAVGQGMKTDGISNNGFTLNGGWARASEGKDTGIGGKFYWETSIDGDNTDSSNQTQINILMDEYKNGNSTGGYISYGSIQGNKPAFAGYFDYRDNVQPFNKGDIIGTALDLDNKEVSFYNNGVFIGKAQLNQEDGNKIYACFYTSHGVTANFGRKAFTYPMPAGYVPYDYVSGINDPISSGGDNPGEETTDPTDSGSGSPEIANQLYIVLEVGETLRASVSENLEDSKNYNWGSENSSVASVNEEGMIVASSVGSTKITGQKKDGSLNGQILVKVVQVGHSSSERVTADMDKGQSVRLFISDEAAGVKWHTNDETVVKVDESGKITAVGNGLALVSAEFNGKTYGTYIRVR